MRHAQTRLAAIMIMLLYTLGFPAMVASAPSVTLEWFSEEDPPSLCPGGYVVKGIECRGRYCDKKRLTCEILQDYGTSGYNWSHWFSEEGGGHFYGGNTVISGIACSGSYCDNLRLLHTGTTGGQPKNCLLTKTISEERPNNSATCPANEYVCGLACSGRYCDSVSVYCSSY